MCLIHCVPTFSTSVGQAGSSPSYTWRFTAYLPPPWAQLVRGCERPDAASAFVAKSSFVTFNAQVTSGSPDGRTQLLTTEAPSGMDQELHWGAPLPSSGHGDRPPWGLSFPLLLRHSSLAWCPDTLRPSSPDSSPFFLGSRTGRVSHRLLFPLHWRLFPPLQQSVVKRGTWFSVADRDRCSCVSNPAQPPGTPPAGQSERPHLPPPWPRGQVWGPLSMPLGLHERLEWLRGPPEGRSSLSGGRPSHGGVSNTHAAKSSVGVPTTGLWKLDLGPQRPSVALKDECVRNVRPSSSRCEGKV